MTGSLYRDVAYYRSSIYILGESSFPKDFDASLSFLDPAGSAAPDLLHRSVRARARTAVSDRRSGAGRFSALRVLYLWRHGRHACGGGVGWTCLRVQLGCNSARAAACDSAVGSFGAVESCGVCARGPRANHLRADRHGIRREDRLHQREQIRAADRQLHDVRDTLRQLRQGPRYWEGLVQAAHLAAEERRQMAL